MKNILLLFSFISCSLVAIAQQSTSVPLQTPPTQAGLFSPLVITNGQANIDGKNSASALYSYTGADSAWTANFINVADKEAIVIMYTKATTANLVITFLPGSIITQPISTPGVNISGHTFTLSSIVSGTFQFMMQRKGTGYTVQITRSSAQ
jgi:hypothetical protein